MKRIIGISVIVLFISASAHAVTYSKKAPPYAAPDTYENAGNGSVSVNANAANGSIEIETTGPEEWRTPMDLPRAYAKFSGDEIDVVGSTPVKLTLNVLVDVSNITDSGSGNVGAMMEIFYRARPEDSWTSIVGREPSADPHDYGLNASQGVTVRNTSGGRLFSVTTDDTVSPGEYYAKFALRAASNEGGHQAINGQVKYIELRPTISLLPPLLLKKKTFIKPMFKR